MKLARDDFKRLRVPLVIGFLMTVLGLGCVVATENYLADANKTRATVKVARQEALRRVDRAAEEEREITSNLSLYSRMMQQGMADPENRLDLIDTIARIKTQRRLFDIRYNLEPQKPLDYPGMVSSPGMGFVTSRMKLDMLLLHEEDLLGFLADLRASGKAYVALRSCTVSSMEAANSLTVAPHLQSQCIVDLIAIKKAKAG